MNGYRDWEGVGHKLVIGTGRGSGALAHNCRLMVSPSHPTR